jgi:hypothetical protein
VKGFCDPKKLIFIFNPRVKQHHFGVKHQNDVVSYIKNIKIYN